MNYTLDKNRQGSLDEVVGELNAHENNVITSKTEHKSQQIKIPKMVIDTSLNLLSGLIGGVAVSALNAMDHVGYNPTISSYLSYGRFMITTTSFVYIAIEKDKPTDALISASCATLGTLLGMYLQRMI